MSYEYTPLKPGLRAAFKRVVEEDERYALLSPDEFELLSDLSISSALIQFDRHLPDGWYANFKDMVAQEFAGLLWSAEMAVRNPISPTNDNLPPSADWCDPA